MRVFAKFIPIFVILICCNNNEKLKKVNNLNVVSNDTTKTPIPTNEDSILELESPYINPDSAIVAGNKYKAYSTLKDSFYITGPSGKIIYEEPNERRPQIEFIDFDQDGFKDILLLYVTSNTPYTEDLFLFNPNSKKYIKVKNFIEFPDAKRLLNKPLYYSYHKSGCADMNWDSDLFYISNFKAIRIGNIEGEGCNDRDKKDGIYIYKITGIKKQLIQIFPIQTIETYKEYKWGFIKEYWNNNYQEYTSNKNAL